MKIGFCSLSLTEDRLSRFGKGCILYACALPWQGRLVPGGDLPHRKPPWLTEPAYAPPQAKRL
jgi:hypothetical protein